MAKANLSRPTYRGKDNPDGRAQNRRVEFVLPKA